MRFRFGELMKEVTARIDGQPFMHSGEDIHAASLRALRRVRDNPLPNRPHVEAALRDIAGMPNSRKRGA